MDRSEGSPCVFASKTACPRKDRLGCHPPPPPKPPRGRRKHVPIVSNASTKLHSPNPQVIRILSHAAHSIACECAAP